MNILPKSSSQRKGWPWEFPLPDPNMLADKIDWPRISIVTPSLNQAAYLEETVRSVLLQNYPNLEYFIMDGGSTDSSTNIIRRYATHLAHWESALDNGQADAINRGFALATGDIFAWLNSDDTYQPGILKRIAIAFQQHPEVDLIYGEGWYMDAAGQRIRPCKFVRPDFSATYFANKDPILQQAAFWRKSLWEQVGPLDITLNWVFDWDWFLRANITGKFHYLPHFLANYRVHSAAKTRQQDVRRRIEQRNITVRYGKRWHPNAVVQQCRINVHHVPTLLKPIACLMCRIAEVAFFGRYTT